MAFSFFISLLGIGRTFSETPSLGSLKLGFSIIAILSIVGGFVIGFAGSGLVALIGIEFGIFWLILGAAADRDERKLSLALRKIESRLAELEFKKMESRES